MVTSLIYNFQDKEKWYWMRQSQVKYHFSESCKLYVGQATILGKNAYIIISYLYNLNLLMILMSDCENLDCRMKS